AQRAARQQNRQKRNRNSHRNQAACPQHFLYFLPDPQGQGSFRPTFAVVITCFTLLPDAPPEPAIEISASSRSFLRRTSRVNSSIEVSIVATLDVCPFACWAAAGSGSGASPRTSKVGV